MPKLIMKLEDRVVKEFVIGTSATIGRLPDNTVMIDNPAISSHHARIFHDGDHFILEDLKSKNGTFVNEKLVLTRRTLKDGDVVVVGKHQLVFDEALLVDDNEAVLEPLGDTVYLDTQGHRELLTKLRAARWARKPAAEASPEPAIAEPARVGVLRVLAGRAERPEYALEANTALIGASEEALVRLHGWFKPKVAVAIARDQEGYVATGFGGDPVINSQPLGTRRHTLKDGDVLDVSGLVMEFRWSG